MKKQLISRTYVPGKTCSDLKQKRTQPMEIARQKEQDRLHTFMAASADLSADAVVLTDSWGIIQYVNPAFERITGYKKDEVLRHGLHILDSGRHDKQFYQNMREMLERDGIWKGELICKKKDSALNHEYWTVSLIKSPLGHILEYLSSRCNMIGDLQLDRIAAGVDAQRNGGPIPSGVKREMDKSVNSLLVTLGVIKAKLGALDKPAVSGYIDRSLNHVSKVAYLLRSLKNGTIYKADELQDIKLPNFLAKCVGLVKTDFASKNIALTTSVRPDAEYCYADPRSLYHVLINLFNNAADALEGRESREISIIAYKVGNDIRLRVKDNGCGMTEEQLRDLYKPFYTTKAHGSGFGLVIVNRLLAAMNGTIKIESYSDVGTTVEITIPAGKGATSSIAARKAS